MEKHLSTAAAVAAAAVAAMMVSTTGDAHADGSGSYPVTVGKQTMQAPQAERLRQERQLTGATKSRAASVDKPCLAVVTVGKANLPAVWKDGQLISALRPSKARGSVAQRLEQVSAPTEAGRFEQRGKATIWVPRPTVVEALDDRRTTQP